MRKRIVLLVVISVLIMLVSAACSSPASSAPPSPPPAGSILTVTPDSNVKTAAAPPFEVLPDMKGWSYQLVQSAEAGIDLYVYGIGAGADPMAMHTSPARWLVYVTAGNAIMELESGDVSFKAGDYIIFPAGDELHGWKGGTADATVVFVTLHE